MIKLTAIEKPLQAKSQRKQLQQDALNAVTTEVFEEGTDLQHYKDQSIETFLGNMAFIGYMGRLNIVDEVSILCAISHLSRQHQREPKPELMIGAETIISNSRIDLSTTSTGRIIFEYICHRNPYSVEINRGYLSEEQHYEHLAEYPTHEISFERRTQTEFYDLYDTNPTDRKTDNEKLS